MHNHRIILNNLNSNKKKLLYNSFQKNKDTNDKIKEEIFDLININMENIKHNLNNYKATIDIDNQLNTTDKENVINYNDENISIISKPISEINSEYEDVEESEKSLQNIFQYENSDNNNDNDISIKEKYLARNLPIFDSNSTSNTYKIHNKKNISICKINEELFHMSEKKDINKNETELTNFFWEINLPTEYTFKFIENGFDDLKILIEMTKSGIAMSNQNLRNIGISKAGDRAKILIRLEEKAGIFPVDLEDKVVYNNNSKHNSLDNFLEKYDEYLIFIL
jgi:hypothetical protein